MAKDKHLRMTICNGVMEETRPTWDLYFGEYQGHFA